MKKLSIVLLIFLLSSNLLLSQITGNGTLGSPYSGTVLTDTSWDPSLGAPDASNNDISTIWATDITINPGATLTINPGGILSFYSGGYDLTISSTAAFVIQPGAAVTVGNVTNDGTLRIESDASEAGSASLILSGYSGTRYTEIQLYLPGGPTGTGGYTWHYVSVPITNIDAIAFNNYNPYPVFNLAQYVESLAVTGNQLPGWVAYDGYQFSSGNTVGYTFSTLNLGQGYDFYSASSPVFTFYTDDTHLLNLTNVNRPVACSSASPESGWNLIGNPFTSCLDWDYTVSHNYIPNVQNAIYFTLNDQPSPYINGVGTNGATGIIPPMQGFFVHATGSSSIPLRTNARTHDPYQVRYKGARNISDNGKGSDTISLVRLKMENLTSKSDMVVRFNNKATTSFDSNFDAYKLNKTNGAIGIWTKTGDIDYSINGLPFPETSVDIPVSIYASAEGVYKLSSNELKNLDNYFVTLKDLTTNTSVDLRKGEFLEINASAGITEDRFILTITNIATGVSDIILPFEKFTIYSSAGGVNILSHTDEFNNLSGTINIYDLTGRVVCKQSNVEWQGRGDLKQLLFRNTSKGLYIVEIQAGNKRYIGKVSIQK
jgi:hypothetical protein